MIKTLKRISIRKSMLSVCLYLTLGILIMAVGGWMYYIADKPLDYTEFKLEDVRGQRDQMVKLELSENYGLFLERTDRKDATLCYAIQVEDADGNICYMMVLMPESYRDEMDRMAELTAQGKEAQPLELVGLVDGMNEEEYWAMIKQGFSMGILSVQGNQIDGSVIFPYKIAVLSNPGSGMTQQKKIYLILFGFGALTAGWMLIWTVLVFAGIRMRWIKDDIKRSGYELYQVEQDYSSAVQLSGNPFVRLGREFLYCFDGATPRAPMRADIACISLYMERHKYKHAITLYRTYSVRVTLRDQRFLDITMPNRAKAMSMIATLVRELGVLVQEAEL
ncbi:MAG: hypothetical protein IJ716_16385 [Lachnospiraceae bacterium]|nr:hypothetical protein [Lachnospiraceae bacterium]